MVFCGLYPTEAEDYEVHYPSSDKKRFMARSEFEKSAYLFY